MNTSRHRLIDAIEMIGNDIALASHYQEILNSDTDDNIDKETVDVLLESCVNRRRDTMRLIFEAGNGSHIFWCATKHSISSYMYATEIYYADRSDVTKKIQQNAYEDMISCLSMFLGVENIHMCGRCMADDLFLEK